MDIGIISIIVSGLVASITALNFINTISVRKEAGLDKFARTAAVDNELIILRKDIAIIHLKLEDHGQKISNLQINVAVTASQMGGQLKELERLVDKVEELKSDE